MDGEEIRQLADQSKKSADEIKAIVETLLADADASIDVMKRLNENFEQQGQMLDSTQQEIAGMASNVNNVSGSAVEISEHVETLNTAKANLVEIIQDLSAISEENAASTEETNASMQELNATFSVINDSAGQLQQLEGLIEKLTRKRDENLSIIQNAEAVIDRIRDRKDRVVIRYYYIEGQSEYEIAEEMDKSRTWVSQRRNLVLDALMLPKRNRTNVQKVLKCP